MNIDFELYRIFYVVANNKNITKAALDLNISQPAISKSIKNLEEQLGGKLFVRTKRGVNLTNEGVEFYNYIKQAVEYIYNAENRFNQLLSLEVGCIKIGISATLTRQFLLPFLEKFHKLYPSIDIQIITDISSVLFSKLRNGLIDIVVLNLVADDYGDDINIVKCRKVTDCFVVNPTFKELLNRKVSLEELNNYPLILQSDGSNTRLFVDKFFNKYNIILKPNIELASYSLVVDFAKIGLGVGYVVKDYIKDELERGSLVALEIDRKIPRRYIGIATSKKHLPNFSTKKFMEMIMEEVNF